MLAAFSLSLISSSLTDSPLCSDILSAKMSKILPLLFFVSLALVATAKDDKYQLTIKLQRGPTVFACSAVDKANPNMTHTVINVSGKTAAQGDVEVLFQKSTIPFLREGETGYLI